MNLKDLVNLSPIYDLLGKRSYAQSGEDLLAALEFSRKKKGFYVDVGSYHPKVFSNTYLFYKKGWRGICIDPNPNLEELYMVTRPRDVFVNLGVAKKDDVRLYTMFEDGAANGVVETEIQKSIAEANRRVVRKTLVSLMPLSVILKKYMPKRQKIDLLSIDCEGMDLEVLQSMDWKKYQPKVIICEDLDFDFRQLRESEISLFLMKKGYELTAKTQFSLIWTKKAPVRR